jgi:hypothetical protein
MVRHRISDALVLTCGGPKDRNFVFRSALPWKGEETPSELRLRIAVAEESITVLSRNLQQMKRCLLPTLTVCADAVVEEETPTRQN